MRKYIRNIVFKNSFFFFLYFNFIFKPNNKLDEFLNSYSKAKKHKLKFIQIGANDGLWNDPLYKYIRRDHWRGILIEPQREIFDRLLRNYRKIHFLAFENLAIDTRNGTRDLYKLSFSNAQWASGLSSFNKLDIQRMIDAGYVERMATQDKTELPLSKECWITTEKVNTISISDLVKKYNYSQLDLLMMDVEGYEYEILKSIPFDSIKIDVIVFEKSHFDEKTKASINMYLKRLGYSIIETESDTIAQFPLY